MATSHPHPHLTPCAYNCPTSSVANHGTHPNDSVPLEPTIQPVDALSASPAKQAVTALNGTPDSLSLTNGASAASLPPAINTSSTTVIETVATVTEPKTGDVIRPVETHEQPIAHASHSSVPPVVEAQTSDLRQPTDPVTQEKAIEIMQSKKESDVTEDSRENVIEVQGGEVVEESPEGGNVNVATTISLKAPEAHGFDTDKMDTRVDEIVEPAAAPSTAQLPLAQMPAEQIAPMENPPEPTTTPFQPPAQAPPIEDRVMVDAPGSPSKNVRAREEDEQEDGPAAKRTRTDDDEAAAASFKVPELPPLATSMPTQTDAERQSSVSDLSKPLTKAQHKFVLSAVRNLKRNKDAISFTHPVDPVKLNIPTYPDIVKNPMDLGTMETKFKDNQYSTLEAVLADLDLIVHNTKIFNGPEHAVSVAAARLRETFDKTMSNFPKADVVEPTSAEKKAKKASAPKTLSARRESRSSTGVAQSPTASASAGSPTTFALGPSGTPLIRRDSTVGDGRPKREIHPPPPRDLPYSTSKPKKKKFQWELKFCQEALNELLKGKYAQIADPFRYPVDPVALNIPHYHKIVKKPMDMSTIGNKLKNGDYENAKEFEADIRLVFQNCYKFNPKGDPINSMGKQLEGVFDEKWSQKAQWIDDHAPVSGPQSLATSPEPEEEEDEEEDEDDEEELRIDMIQKQIDMMKEQVELMRKKKSSPAAGGKKASKSSKPGKKVSKKSSGSLSSAKAAAVKPDKKKKKAASKKDRTPYITYEQKQEISNRINTLPPNRMTTALKIIRDNMPNLKGIQDDELELDIDELSDEVLHKLYQFVQKYAPGGRGDHEEESKPARSKATAEGRSGSSEKPKKNKPMGKSEQEARIRELQGKLKSYQNAGSDDSPEPSELVNTLPPAERLANRHVAKQDDDAESSDDDDESGSESEEE